MRRRNDGAGVSPQEEFGDVCFHALGIIDQNREYLQMHLLASADLPTRQALSDIQIESARLDRTVRNAITLYQLENEELSELQPLDLCGLLEKAGRLAPDIQRSLEITLTAESGGIEHCAVMGVPDEAEQLLLHLISNALRACDAGGRVWVSLKQKKTGVALRVEDNGLRPDGGRPHREQPPLPQRRKAGPPHLQAHLPPCRLEADADGPSGRRHPGAGGVPAGLLRGHPAGNGTPLRRGERHPRSAVRKPGGTGDPSAAEILNETKRHLQCGRDGAAQMPLLCVRDREESKKIDRR